MKIGFKLTAIMAVLGLFAITSVSISGKVKLNVLEDLEDPAYLLAKNSGNPTILDPYEYSVGGKMVLMTSMYSKEKH
jgi:hypothetical protein